MATLVLPSELGPAVDSFSFPSLSPPFFRCTVMGVRKDCSELFQTTFIDLGLCCSFNILPEVLVHDKPFEKEEDTDEVRERRKK